MSINLTFPLKRSSKGPFATNDDTLSAVKDDIRILLLTNHGERPIHSDFGANLRSILFEPDSSVTQKAEDLILAAIEKWLPFVNVIDINVTASSNNRNLQSNELNIELEFEIGQIRGALKQRVRT